jgi:hypothetical protein
LLYNTLIFNTQFFNANFLYYWGEDSGVLVHADVSMGHITGDLNTTNYYFTSWSLSKCLFRSHFRAKLSPQWQWKSFCVQSYVSLQTDLPTECLPTDQHTKPFSPHCIITCHIKYPLSVRILTCCTCVLFVTSVNTKMKVKSAVSDKTFVTHWTLVGTIVCMYPRMFS